MTSQTLPSWRDIWSRSLHNRVNFKRGMLVYGGLVYWLVVWAIHAGHPWIAGPGELLASLLAVFLTGWLWEDYGQWTTTTVLADGTVLTRNQLQKFSPKTQSWAFLADTYGLAPMAAFGALTYPLLHHNTLFTGSLWWLWALILLVPGGVAAYLFSRNEGNVYDVLRRNSYTKLIHNGISFTVLTAIVLFTLIPIVFTGEVNSTAPYSWLAIAGFGLWFLSGMVGDSWRAGLEPGSRFYSWALRPEYLHPQADEHGHWLHVEFAGVDMWNVFRGLHTGEAFDMSDVLHTKRMLFHTSRVLSPLALRWRQRRGTNSADEEAEMQRRPGDDDRTGQDWVGRPPDRPD